jgi:hypothetical protein
VRLAAATALLALVIAAPASAGERLIATRAPYAYGLEAAGGWVGWERWVSPQWRQVLWHDGDRIRSDRQGLGHLGTDASGRAVEVIPSCEDDRCTVSDRLLPDGAEVERVVTGADDLQVADEQRGSFLMTFGGHGHPRGVFIQRRGEHELSELAAGRHGNVSISGLAMMTAELWNNQLTVYGASRDRPHDWRRLAQGRERDEGRSRKVSDPQTDGRFVYWLEASWAYHDGKSVKGSYRTAIVRVDPGAAHPRTEKLIPPRRILSLAVDHGRVYYAASQTNNVYELTNPEF